MPANKNQLARLQILDKCFSDPTREYTLKDLMDQCGSSRATIERDLIYIQQTYGKDVFAACRKNKRTFRYMTAGFTIFSHELSTAQLAQIKSLLIMLNKFVGKPQFEHLQSIVRRLECQYQITIPDTSAVVHFEGNIYLKGAEYLVPIFEAIINKSCLQVQYRPFVKVNKLYTIHPYMLKEYHGRWYVLCGKQENAEEPIVIRTLALDRIVRVIKDETPFQEAAEDITDYFDDIIGISKKPDHKIREIVIKCVDRKQFMYIQTNPIHPSQKPVKNKANHILIEVRENYELYQNLLFYGDKIEIVSPEYIRDEFKKVVAKISRLYEIRRNG